MPSDRKPSLILPVAMVALLLAGYVGAYYAMVRPVGTFGNNADTLQTWDYGFQAGYNRNLDMLFTPLIEFDRRIRPHVWELSN